MTTDRRTDSYRAYMRRHYQIQRVRGLATDQQCVRCPKQATDWAQLHTEDGTDPWADYVPMCRSCHLIYDGNGRGPKSLSAKGLANHRAAARRRVGVGQCVRCGCSRDTFTEGCLTCDNRRWDRRRQPRNRSVRS